MYHGSPAARSRERLHVYRAVQKQRELKLYLDFAASAWGEPGKNGPGEYVIRHWGQVLDGIEHCSDEVWRSFNLQQHITVSGKHMSLSCSLAACKQPSNDQILPAQPARELVKHIAALSALLTVMLYRQLNAVF